MAEDKKSKEQEVSVEEEVLNADTDTHTSIFSDEQQSTDITPEDQALFDKDLELEKKYGDSPVRTAVESAASAATFGISDQVLSKFDEEGLAERRKRNEASALAGEITGVVGPALLSGGSSLAAKGASAGFRTAAKTGLATEKVVSKTIQKLIGEQGKKSVVKDILRKGVEKSAGLTAEGTFYSTGNLISEDALGTAEFNAENLIANAKETAVFSSLLGLGAGTFSAIVPVFKNNKVTKWTTEKFKGSKPQDLEDAAVLTMGGTKQQAAKLKKLHPEIYNNTPKYVLEDLALKPVDNAAALAAKNDDIITQTAIKLDDSMSQLDDVLKKGDDLGESFLGTSNAEVADDLIENMHKWKESALMEKNAQGVLKRSPGVSESEYNAILKEIDHYEDVFGIKELRSATVKSERLAGSFREKIGAQNYKVAKLEQTLEDARKFAHVPKIKENIAKVTSQKKQLMKKLVTKEQTIERKIIANNEKIRMSKDPAAKRDLREKNAILRDQKRSAKLDAKAQSSALDDKIQILKNDMKGAPKSQEAVKDIEAKLLAARKESAALENSFNSEMTPLHKRIMKLQDDIKAPVNASRIREIRKRIGKKAKWKAPSDAIDLQTKFARKQYEMLNNQIYKVADSVKDVSPKLVDDILKQNLTIATGMKLADGINKAALASDSRGVFSKLLFAGAMKNVIGTSGAFSAIPFILQSQATYEALKAVGAAHLSSRARLLSSVEKANQSTKKSITKSISSFFGKTARKVKKVSKPAAMKLMLKSDLAAEVSDSGTAKRPKDEQQAFKNITNNIADMKKDPDQLLEYAAQSFPELEDAAPRTKQMVTQHIINMVQYLDSKLPKNATFNPTGLSKRDWTPSTLELAKFARVLKAVSDPLSVLEDLEDGTITREGAEALRVLKPNLYAQIQDQVMEQIATSEDTVPYEKRLQLGILLDIDSDASLNGHNIAGLQEMHNEAVESQTGGQSQFSASKAEKLNLAESAQTTVEKTERR